MVRMRATTETVSTASTVASGTVDPNQHKLHWRSNNPDHSPAFDA
jgi:hypothetical protein